MSEADQLERNLEQDREHLRETLGALEEKMSPGRLLDEAMAYFNTGPKAFASDLTTQVRNNPMPALLTGVGLAWLMMSDRKAPTASSETTASPERTSWDYSVDAADYDAWSEHERLQQAEWACVRLESETPEAHALRLDQARAAALGLAYDPQEDHTSFSTRVRSAADTVRQKGGSARDKLKRAAASAKHGAGSMTSAGAHGLKSAAGSTVSGAKAAATSGMHLHETNPIATAAIGVALGALLGAALPLSRTEEKALGDVADKGLKMGADLSRKASDAMSEKVQPTDDGAGSTDRAGPAGQSMAI